MTIEKLQQKEREIEAEVQAEGLQRFQSFLQEQSDLEPAIGSDSKPLKKVRMIPMQVKTSMGIACVSVKCGVCKTTGKYETPFRVNYFKGERGAISPELEQRVVAMACETGSYEKAAKLCEKWGCDISDDKIMDTVERVAESCHDSQLPKYCDSAAGKHDTLIVMMDGWMARHRGDKWGKKKAPMEERVGWREIKSAVIFKLSDVATVSRERRMLIKKHIIAMPAGTDPVEFGKKVECEAIRMGMLKAVKVYVIIDGGIYLWGVYEDRFSEIAIAQLDFYHAAEHIQALAEYLFTDKNREDMDKWVTRLTHNLKVWGPNTLLQELAKLKDVEIEDKEQAKGVNREAEYFLKHKSHMNYRQARKDGVPIGSGSVESLCSQLQNRFKRTGQFWSCKGLEAFLTVYTRYTNDEMEHCYKKSA